MASRSVSAGQKVALTVDERDIVKLVLEFMENRRIHISQVTLERETGLINGAFSNDILFLRQLILDGQWDSVLQFVEPLKALEGFPSSRFHFLISKCKYFELLCIKQEPGPINGNFAVEEIVECLKELESLCDSSEEFRKLCALLTLPKLTENEHFRLWNPYSARMDCFQSVLPLVVNFVDGVTQKSAASSDKHSTGDRLVQLVVRGLLYEYALVFCQQQALEGKNDTIQSDCHFSELLSGKEKLSSADLALISWLEMLGSEHFILPFQQKEFIFRLNPHTKPNLEAQWSEQILTTPIKPGGQFPYSMVPHSKPMFAQKMMVHSMSASLIMNYGQRRPIGSVCSQPMSQSTLPSVGSFTIQRPSDVGVDIDSDVMRQSQMLSDMLSESSLNTLPSNPSQTKRHTISSSRQNNDSSPSMVSSQVSSSTDSSSRNPHQQLEAICQRNQIKLLKKEMCDISLASVPELDTPVGDSVKHTFPSDVNQKANIGSDIPMEQSQLFQQFQAVKSQQQQQQLEVASAYYNEQQPPVHFQQQKVGSYPLFQNCAQNVHFQPHQPIPMRFNVPPTANSNSEQDLNNGYLYNITKFQLANVPSMSNRPTSMTIPPVTMRAYDTFDPSVVRTRSYLDNPIELDHLSSDCPNVTVDSENDQMRRSIEDDELLLEDTENTKDSCGFVGENCAKQSEEPLKFVPVCCYEDAQAIRAVAFHPSGGYFMIGTNSRNLLFCRYQSSDFRPSLNDDYLLGIAPPPTVILNRSKHHRGSVYCAAFNQTGELLATGSNDKTIKLMALQTDANECRIGVEMDLQQVHDGTVRDLIFMEDRISTRSSSSTLISGGAGNCRICVTNCETGRAVRSFQEHSAPILGLYNWGYVNSFVSCSYDKTIRFWDLRASNATSVIWPTQSMKSSRVTNVCVDPSGKLLVSGHEDASVMLYDICGGRTVQIFRPHGDEVRTVRFSNAAYYLLTGSYDKRIVITDMRGNLAEPLPYLPVAQHRDKVIQCRWHPRDFVFLSTSADKTAVLWSLPSKSI